MKAIKKYTLAAAGVLLLGGALSSCSNELNAPGNSGGNNNFSGSPVIGSEVVAWSGNQTLSNSFTGVTYSTPSLERGNAGDGDLNNLTWKNFDTTQLAHITEEERQNVLAAIAEKKTGSKISEDIVFPWEDYFLHDVINMENGNYPNAGNNGMKDVSVSNLEVWNKGGDCTPNDHHVGDDVNYEQVTNSKKINNFFLQTVNGGQDKIEQITLMTDMTLGSYEEMQGRQFRTYHNCHIRGHYYDYITVNVNGSWYICFDLGCGDAEHDHDGDPGSGATYNDWDYNDWIIKISPAIPVNSPGYEVPAVWRGPSDDDDDDSSNPETPDPETPTPGEPGDGDQENNGSGSNPPSNGGNESGDNNTGGSNNVKVQNEVEINLALNDIHTLPNGQQKYDVADLVSKLSIHVRYPKDVEVILPVPEKFYCDQDDLYILTNHYDFEYGGETVEYVNIVGENTVTLTVEYVAAKDDNLTGLNQGYIRVFTAGINEEVIEYCRENFGDGINFEVYNYYNRGNFDIDGPYDEIDYETLQYDYLSRSLVNFDWSVIDVSQKTYPDHYINAFNQIGNQPNKGDCYVWIMGDNRAKIGSGLYGDNSPYTSPNGATSIIKWRNESTDNREIERNNFWNAYQGVHYNGSPLNWIYTWRDKSGTIDPTTKPDKYRVMENGGQTFPFIQSPNQSFMLESGSVITLN